MIKGIFDKLILENQEDKAELSEILKKNSDKINTTLTKGEIDIIIDALDCKKKSVEDYDTWDKVNVKTKGTGFSELRSKLNLLTK